MRHPVSFIATAQPDQARSFYRDVLGLNLREETPFALVFHDGTHQLRIQILEQLTPADHTVHGWQVSDIEGQVRDLSAKGVVFERFAALPQDDQGVWRTPDGHKVAWFKDPCGNVLSLTEYALP